MAQHTWYVYLLRDDSDSLYTGISTDVERRFREHVEGGIRSAKFTRSRKGLKLVYRCRVGSRSAASKVEYRLKRLPKNKKEALVREAPDGPVLLERLGLWLDD